MLPRRGGEVVDPCAGPSGVVAPAFSSSGSIVWTGAPMGGVGLDNDDDNDDDDDDMDASTAAAVATPAFLG